MTATAPPTSYGYAELTDGTSWRGVRVTLATKIAFERAARANKWNHEDNAFTVSAFFSWHAARLAGRHTLEWDQFLAQVIDAGVEDTAPDEAHGQEEDGDPTRPAAGTE